MIVFQYPYDRLKSLFQGDGSRARSMRATMLMAGAFGASKVMQLGSNLVLTRILFPEAFGLMTLVFVFIGALQLLSDVGVQPSIIRSARGDAPEFLQTAWTVMVVRGVWITGLAFVLAWPYARLYDQDILFPLICILPFRRSYMAFRQSGAIFVNATSSWVASCCSTYSGRARRSASRSCSPG